ncbi:MAG: lysophospholipid acyltransferase family protein [Fidelibacterota bacterium]
MRSVWVIINLIVWTLILGITTILGSLFERGGRFGAWIARVWSKIILFTAGVSYRVVGLENLEADSQYLFAANHESAFDILLAYASLPYPLVSIAKIELKKIPIFGWAMAMAGHIFVDRSNHEKALKSLRTAAESLRKHPRSILLFPEGTRSTDEQVHRFKKGGLLLALESGLKVVPMACCGTGRALKKHSLNLGDNQLELRVGSPISTVDFSFENRQAFVDKVREKVVALKENGSY